MRIVVTENMRGFLFRNGIYKKLLKPGQHRISTLFGDITEIVSAIGQLNLDKITLKIVSQDKEFQEATASIVVPDSHIAMHFIDGRLAGSLTTGEYTFWNIFEANTFELIDISQPESTEVPAYYFNFINDNLYWTISVGAGEACLLFYDKEYIKTLTSGTYRMWNSVINVTKHSVDTRLRELTISGQEILTADKVGVRINFVCSFNVIDPVKTYTELSDFDAQVYSMVQLALRKYVGGFRLDELLDQKDIIAEDVLRNLQSSEADLFVKFQSAGLRDIILPGDIQDIMNTVLVAEKTAQANVIARREEVASTRSLLNTAKLLDENETLRKLKELEYLERICDKVGNISVSNNQNILGQLQDLVTR